MNTNEHTFVKRKYNPSIKDFLMHISKNPHNNFPVIAEVFDDYYVMEYIKGKTLVDVLNEGCLSHETAKYYMLQLLDALELIHSFNIVHRDVKPENIIITKDGTLKLIDFDISRKIVTKKNCDTQLLGTAGYAAPEQFGFTQTDERSDIFAAGIVYNFMLTGKVPLEATVSGEIGKIIAKCTKIDKYDRYKSIDILRRDIKKERFTSYNLLDIIPGFRTRNLYKMIFATLIYILTFIGYFVLAYEEAPKSNVPEIVLFYTVYAALILYSLVFFAVAANFMGVAQKLKLPIKNKKIKVCTFLFLWFIIGVGVTGGIHGELKEGFSLNPISITFSLVGYMLYSIIEAFFIGML